MLYVVEVGVSVPVVKLQRLMVTVFVADTLADHTKPDAGAVTGDTAATMAVVAVATVVFCCAQVCVVMAPGAKAADVATSGAGVVPAGTVQVPAPLRK